MEEERLLQAFHTRHTRSVRIFPYLEQFAKQGKEGKLTSIDNKKGIYWGQPLGRELWNIFQITLLTLSKNISKSHTPSQEQLPVRELRCASPKSSILDSGSQSLLACISRLEEKGSFVSPSCPAQSLDSEELG